MEQLEVFTIHRIPAIVFLKQFHDQLCFMFIFSIFLRKSLLFYSACTLESKMHALPDQRELRR